MGTSLWPRSHEKYQTSQNVLKQLLCASPCKKMRFREFQNLFPFCYRLFWKSAKSTSTPTPTNALPFLELKHHTWDLNETILYFEIGAEIALRGVTLRDLFKNGIQTPQNDVKTQKPNFYGGSAPRPPEIRRKPMGATPTELTPLRNTPK